MMGTASKVRTALALGLPSILRVAGYRFGVKLGLNPVRRLRASVPAGPFFLPPPAGVKVRAPAVQMWETEGRLFSHWAIPISDQPPDWLANPLNGQRVATSERAWWQIADFDPAVGDIKLLWELSRMDWVLAFAQRVRLGDRAAEQRLNNWLGDWCFRNPPYQGPNWKCGQEASIRVMHLAIAAMMTEQERQSTPGLLALIRMHLQRIAPTIDYAIAQNNNHGTSEAAALFIGGSWLAACGVKEGIHWASLGRRWLENLMARLIGPDGSFSQYSLNYHRVMLDTVCMTEVWRRHMKLPAFSTRWQTQSMAATQWLQHMVNPVNGDGPNVGANDGARLLQLTNTGYRDHRPTVQLAMALFANKRAYAEHGPWDHGLAWLGLDLPQGVASASEHYVADDGGFAMLRRRQAMAMLRYPRFRFRPSQADALHLDLWLGEENLLRDAGSFGYNSDPHWLTYFGGTASHNTAQFDGRDQMPRISRFLLGDWLKTQRLEPLREFADATHFGAGYRDGKGASHFRRMRLSDTNLQVEDELGGFEAEAVLRWRLAPDEWHIAHTQDGVSLNRSRQSPIVLTVRSASAIVRAEIVEGWESRHYLEKTPVQVLEIAIRQPGTLTTEIRWAA
jgi:hypothetical protein